VKDPHYKAFISYSHQDQIWATWLHDALESFSVPKRLIGTNGAFGPVHKNLMPVFLDREELSSGSDLSQHIQDALTASETLIVICSPESAKSRWVNEEISLFKKLGRAERIYSIIVAGDPQAANEIDRCFPSALLVDDDGKNVEPLAADVREWGDGKNLARQKIISGVLGIRLDELRQREVQRKRKLRLIAGVSISVFLAIAGSAIFAKRAEILRMDHAENLVAQMVDLSNDLEHVVDLDTLKRLSERLVSYLETIDPDDLSDDSSLQISAVLQRLGKVHRLQGNADEAMSTLVRSRDILRRIADRSPENEMTLFELGQGEFWVGYLHVDKGDLEQAEIAFKKYLSISEQLHRRDPENAEWAMEMAYALSNMGVIEQSRTPANKVKQLEFLEAAMGYNELAVRLAPDEEYYQIEMAGSYANMGDAWLEICNLDSALHARTQNVLYAAEFHLKNPKNNRLTEHYAYALSGLAGVQRMAGKVESATNSLKHAVSLLQQLTSNDSSNVALQRSLNKKQTEYAELLLLRGESEAAWVLTQNIQEKYQQLIGSDKLFGLEDAGYYVKFLSIYSLQARANGRTDLADLTLQQAVDYLSKLRREHPDSKIVSQQTQSLSYELWRQKPAIPALEIQKMVALNTQPNTDALSCRQAVLSSQVSIVQGDTEKAQAYAAYLHSKKFFDPEYLQFCRQQSLCAGES